MGDETRRRHRRLLLDVAVRMTSIDAEVDPGTGGRYFRVDELRCGNLSPGGAFLRSADPPARGQRLLLEFRLGGGESVQAKAKVAWSKRVVDPSAPDAAGMGVEFDPRERGSVARLLARRAPGSRSRSG